MALADVLREARTQRGMTQEEIAVTAYISPKTVSAIECGRRQIAADSLEALVKQMDDPWLTLEAAVAVTGGVGCSPRLNGSEVDLHRGSVRTKTVEELQEALRKLAAVTLVNRPKQDAEQQKEVWDLSQELLDAKVAIDTLVAVCCVDYGISFNALYRHHWAKLRARGYIKETAPGRAAR